MLETHLATLLQLLQLLYRFCKYVMGECGIYGLILINGERALMTYQ